MNKDQLLKMLREQKPILMRKYPLHRLALFGSWARGEQTELSDIDILADVDPSIGLRFVSLAEDLEKALGGKVDLVSQRGLRPRLRELVEREIVDA